MKQRWLTSGRGYRLPQMMEQRIAGLAFSGSPGIVACGEACAGGARAKSGQGAAGVPWPHHDSPAYERGGGQETPLDDWRGWQSSLRPLVDPGWVWRLPKRSSRFLPTGRQGGPIRPPQSGLAVPRDAHTFRVAAHFRESDGLPTWPDRSAPRIPGGGPAPVFKVHFRTRDDVQRAPLYPHVPASADYGDVAVVVPRYQANMPSAAPRYSYLKESKAYFPRTILPNPHLYYPGATHALEGYLGSSAAAQNGSAPIEHPDSAPPKPKGEATRSLEWAIPWLIGFSVLLALPAGLRSWRNALT